MIRKSIISAYIITKCVLMCLINSLFAGQSSRTESSNQLDATEEQTLHQKLKQSCRPESLFQSSTNLPVKSLLENQTRSSTEESSSISSSEEEDRINAQKSHGQSQETIFVKVYNIVIEL